MVSSQSDQLVIRLLGPGDLAILENVAPDVFDEKLDPKYSREFLEDPRHHLVVALDVGRVVGFASGVHYVHPDKPSELWVNEVGVAPSRQRRGIARELLEALFTHGGTSDAARPGWGQSQKTLLPEACTQRPEGRSSQWSTSLS